MRHQILSDSEDEQVGFVKGQNQTIKSQPTGSLFQLFQQSGIQCEEQQASTMNFKKEISLTPKQLKNIINSTDLIKQQAQSNAEYISQSKNYQTANDSGKLATNTFQKVKTKTGRKDLLLLIEGPITQQPNQKFNQHRIRRRMIDQEFEDRSNEFYAKLQRQLKNKLKAQIKYLDDKKQERRKAREAEQSQGSFIQAIKQLFGFSKQDKKLTQ